MASSSGGHLRNAKSTERVDSVDAETSLIRAVYHSLAQTGPLADSATEPLDRATASKLLYLCCNFDSAECTSALLGGELGTIPLVDELNESGKSQLHTAAAAHSVRCVEVLLKKHARTDLRTKDGQAQLALELSLCDARNPNDFSIEDLLSLMSEKDLSAVKLLSDKTKETAEDAYAVAALLIVAADKVNDSVLDLRDSESVTSPLIRAAAQGGDEADVNDADADGNSAIHCIVKLSTLLCPQQIKILLLLLEHGARVSQRNKLGLTAFHIAAGNGNSEALEVLLLEDPDGVQYQMEMKETPLFFASKNESVDCAEFLLTWGANSEILNLWQRAIDPTTSQDMRYNPTTVSLINHAFPSQHKCTAFELTDEDTTTERNVNSSTKAEVCKYFNSHRGCVRGAKCFYAHCEEESLEVKEGVDQSHSPAAKQLKCKIFVGGLPPSVHSDVLGKFFEEEFGSVEDAMVILNQIQNKIQSRGSGLLGSNWKYDEDSKSGETIMPVKFEVNGVDLAEIQGGESTITKKAFRISSEVARVHKSIMRNGMTWKCGQHIELLKGACAGVHKNNLDATIDFFLLEGLQDEFGGEAGILCRPSSLSDEKGCILSVNDVDTNLEMGASLSVPLIVLDAGKVCGTTIVAVKFKEGIIFGVDARIVGELNGYKLIASDDSAKFLVISPNLVYLMAGYQKQCHDLYNELVNMVAEASKVVSVTEALGVITAYLDKFVADHPDNTRNFGGIIGGWSETEGFEAYQFGVDKTNQEQILSIDKDSYLSMGAGGQHATYVLIVRTMTGGANMSKLEAVETVMKSLLYASYLSDSTGGKLSAFCLKANGIVTTEKVLEPCNVDPEYHRYYASRILLVLLDKLFAGWNINEMKTTFKTMWPAVTSSRVAQKESCFYYRLYFQSYEAAQAAFEEVSNKSVSPEDQFVHHSMKSMRFVKKDGKKGFVNVGKCTKDLLKYICELK